MGRSRGFQAHENGAVCPGGTGGGFRCIRWQERDWKVRRGNKKNEEKKKRKISGDYLPPEARLKGWLGE